MRKGLTLKQRRLIRCLPSSNSLREAGRKAGFKSNHIYRDTVKKHIKSVYTKEWVLNEFEDVKRLAKKDKDYANTLRATENIGKLNGYYVERIEGSGFNNIHVLISGKDRKDKDLRNDLHSKDIPQDIVVDRKISEKETSPHRNST